MSTTLGTIDPTQQQPPPFPPEIQEPVYKPHSGHGSAGPVIGVLAVIIILGVVAVMIGRLCSGRRVMGHLQYDFEGWVETKCSNCIDGSVGPGPPLRRQTVVPEVVVVVAENGGRNEGGATPAAVESRETTAGEGPGQVEEVINEQESQEQHRQH